MLRAFPPFVGASDIISSNGRYVNCHDGFEFAKSCDVKNIKEFIPHENV